MKRSFQALCFCLAAVNASAASINVAPGSPTVNVGGSLAVDVHVTGLTTGFAPSLSAFQLDFTYDNTLLAFSSIIFGGQLSLNATPSLSGVIPGVGSAVTVFESSFNTATELNDLQSGDFLLFQITFTALSAGVSPLSIANFLAIDSANPPGDISPSFTVSGSSVEVISGVPEPATFGLFGAGFAALLLAKRKIGK